MPNNLILIWIVSFLAVIAASWFRNLNQQNLKFIIAFTGGFLLTICVVHLLPEVYTSGYSNVSYFILGGFLIQILLDQLSAGVEHGHFHIHKENKWGTSLMITGLFIHSLMEGIPLGTFDNSVAELNPIQMAIFLHKIPEGLALGLLLIEFGFKGPRFYWIALLFSIMTPAGSWMVSLIPAVYIIVWTPLLLSLVIGLFLHLSTSILFEAGSTNHKVSLRRIISILVGICAAYFLN